MPRGFDTEPEPDNRCAGQEYLARGAACADICGVIVFLGSDAAGCMTGQATNVTGGQEMR